MSHLTGRAESWATAEWSWKSPVCSSLSMFTKTFSKIFECSSLGLQAARVLMGLQQGAHSVNDYAIKFRTLAADGGWNNSLLRDAFNHGLSSAIQNLLVTLSSLRISTSSPSLLSGWINGWERDRETKLVGLQLTEAPPRSLATPRQHLLFPWRSPCRCVTHVSHRRSASPLKEGRCIYCALKGHFLASFPVKITGSSVRKRTQVSRTQAVTSSPHPLTHAEMLLDSKCHKLHVLFDSGANKSFVDWSLVTELGIATRPFPVPQEATGWTSPLLGHPSNHPLHHQDGSQSQ